MWSERARRRCDSTADIIPGFSITISPVAECPVRRRGGTITHSPNHIKPRRASTPSPPLHLHPLRTQSAIRPIPSNRSAADPPPLDAPASTSPMGLPPIDEHSARSTDTANTMDDSALFGQIRSCTFCTDLKILKNTLPPKRCDYCNELKCQFCTLKFPLLHVRKVLPKSMKGNTRICLPCFSRRWEEHTQKRGSSHDKKKSSSSRQSVLSSESMDMRESVYQDALWAGKESFDEAMLGSLRESLMKDSPRRESMMMGPMSPVGASTSGGTAQPQQLPPFRSPPTSHLKAGRIHRLAHWLGLVIENQTGRSPNSKATIHIVDLWVSLFAAAVLVMITVSEGLSLPQRTCFCMVVYGLFLAVHPWIHNSSADASPKRTDPSYAFGIRERIASGVGAREIAHPQQAEQSTVSVSGRLPVEFKARLKALDDELDYYLNETCPWKFIKSTSSGKIYETANEKDQPMFKIEEFIPEYSISEFLAYMNPTDIKDRLVWDYNVAKFAIVETFKEDNVSVTYNAQKSFLGGLVSSRDFSLLYATRDNYIVYTSIEHPAVPEKQGLTRGTVHFGAFHCTEELGPNGEKGFLLRYMCQVDIGGSIPQRLLYNGTMDNLEKNMKVFKQAKNLFRK